MIAYAVLGFPLALIAIRPSIAQASPRLEEAARSLGQPPLAVFRRVTLPLIAPGLAAAVSIVFLSSVTELTATLVLRPTGHRDARDALLDVQQRARVRRRGARTRRS